MSTAAYAAAVGSIVESVRKSIVNRAVAHEISRDYVAVGLAVISLSLVAGAPATMSWCDEVTGMFNLAFLLHGVAAMAAMVCVAGFLRSVERLHVRVRTAAGLFAVCTVALVVLYLARGTTDPDFGASSDHHAASIAYNLIYLVYMCAWLVLFIRGSWFSTRREERVVQFGVFLAAVGMAFGLLGLGWKIALTVHGILDPGHILRDTRISLISQAIGVVLFAAGSVFAAAVRRLHDRRDRRRNAAVTKLWCMLEPVRNESAILSDDECPDLRRQVVEIFDGILVLRRYIPSEVGDVAAEFAQALKLDHGSTKLLLGAAELRVALEYYQEGVTFPQVGNDVDARPQSSTVRADEDDEIASLARLVSWMASEVVEEIVRVVRSMRDDGPTSD
ncbi:MAB_1171c family putative transporter [Amycolatopsis anabasis]|uniref:MAB_1171c family putative transporter n=1 Tax=Amycolatopsis anabasis TaxID=1840409 RepID=UPI00131CB98F|nr:MAB_1171c family putative transporter [Amycolatopsis anabasis]